MTVRSALRAVGGGLAALVAAGSLFVLGTLLIAFPGHDVAVLLGLLIWLLLGLACLVVMATQLRRVVRAIWRRWL
ncbi:hypothetical protein ACGFNU_21465 [Spirillospora sp. NPDC048911]|uniref:hypothetical protein n=1 Tax=Spirillospora sp. NPDC048911 TaxID=3364527 RepID=UPI003711CC56